MTETDKLTDKLADKKDFITPEWLFESGWLYSKSLDSQIVYGDYHLPLPEVKGQKEEVLVYYASLGAVSIYTPSGYQMQGLGQGIFTTHDLTFLVKCVLARLKREEKASKKSKKTEKAG